MSKVALTVTVPAGFGKWLRGIAHEKDRSVGRLVLDAWKAQAEALAGIEPDSEEKNAMHVAGLYLRGLEDLAKLGGEPEGYGELSITLSEDVADAIDEEVDRLEVPADVIVAWVCEKAFDPPSDVAMFRG
jgi:hypothetical protein